MILVRIPMVNNRNNSYDWLFSAVKWAADNCSSFKCPIPPGDTISGQAGLALEPYIVRDPSDLHFKFEFNDNNEATLFMLRWS